MEECNTNSLYTHNSEKNSGLRALITSYTLKLSYYLYSMKKRMLQFCYG